MATDPTALFAAHQHRLFKYFCRAVGETETARDLTQDVFLRVSRQPSRWPRTARSGPGCFESPGTSRSITTASVCGTPSHRSWWTKAVSLDIYGKLRTQLDSGAIAVSVETRRRWNDRGSWRSVESVIQVKPEEIVEIRLPKLDDSAGPFANRDFSIRIRARQLR
jgi:hypothetical protein